MLGGDALVKLRQDNERFLSGCGTTGTPSADNRCALTYRTLDEGVLSQPLEDEEGASQAAEDEGVRS